MGETNFPHAPPSAPLPVSVVTAARNKFRSATRYQCAADQPWSAHAQIQGSFASSGHQAELFVDTGGSARRCQLNPRYAKIVGQPALEKYSPIEYLPGAQVRSDDEAGLAKSAGDIGTTIFHPVGIARMGRDDDSRAVVDARLRVIGIDCLRVVDASVMPSITSGNTNSPTMMIAEKGAAMILEDQKRL